MVSSIRMSTAPAGSRFPGEVIAVAVPWCLRYGTAEADGQFEALRSLLGIRVVQ